MKKAIGLLLASACTIAVIALLIQPQTKIMHQDSSAFQLALNQAVNRLEGGGKLLLAGTATPVGAQVYTIDAYTCDTYEQVGMATCDPMDPQCRVYNYPQHTEDPVGHTCVAGEYTCQWLTCDTYDPQQWTCDVQNDSCIDPQNPGHTFEPPPYNHTCEGHTCDGAYTCDFTVDPRAYTCDAANWDCAEETFDYAYTTCDPMRPECRDNNPKPGAVCTAQDYFTCDGDPQCANPTGRTSWGKTKHIYE